ncbi:MAG: hypothetical protein F9K32_14310 [Desulfobulbaceae bacterium]|nr:MAG: hypothetical protein F9K32_14310 [Desulfobulbaceae bacterium]
MKAIHLTLRHPLIIPRIHILQELTLTLHAAHSCLAIRTTLLLPQSNFTSYNAVLILKIIARKKCA